MKPVIKIRTRAKNMIKILKPITTAYTFILEKEKEGRRERERERRKREGEKEF